MAQLTLAQRLAQLESTLPEDLDPEDFVLNDKRSLEDGEGNEEVRIANTGREHYVEVGPSILRRNNENLNDLKYEGVKISRSKLLDYDNSDATERNDDFEDVPPSVRNEGSQSSSSSLPSSEEEEETRIKIPRKRSQSESASEEKAIEDLDTKLHQTRLADKLKGQAVSRQLRIWDALVDSRIQLQKTVLATNRLPLPQAISQYMDNPGTQESVRQYLSQAYLLSEELFQLRRALLKHAGSDPPPPKRQAVDIEILEGTDYQALFEKSIEEMMDFESQTHVSDLSSLQKWSTKVQAVAPSALLPASRGVFKMGPVYVKSAGDLVDEALKDIDKLTRNARCRTDRIGLVLTMKAGNDDDDEDEETFDDRDFYRTMLRDVIESKGNKESVADLYANSKKHRKKKNVNTKASKGRKLRYEPHEKILSFMVPVPVQGAWHEEQIDELFASLLGFEDSSRPNDTDGDVAIIPEQPGLQAFRVFG